METSTPIRPSFNFRKSNVALFAVILLVAAGCTRKAGREGGFEYTAGGWEAELTGVSMPGKDDPGASGTGAERERLVVPSRLGRKRVGSVAAGAFRNTDAVSVKIPWRVSRIGAGAFAGCTNLVWAELPSRLERVEEGMFLGCIRMEESDVPERVESIGPRAYSGCSRLRRVALPEKLRAIGEHSFSGCTLLESVDLPEGISDIPDGAFEGCGRLRAIRIPEGVTNIGARAFAGCVSLEEIAFPAGLRSVGEEAFAGCGLLEGVVFPEKLERLGKRAFAECGGLRSVEVAAGNPVFSVRDGVLFRDGGTGLELFPSTRGGRYEVPEGVRAIGDGAFAGCGLLEEVSIPGSVERLGEEAFEGCGGLRSVEVAEDNPVFSVRDGVLFRDGGAELVLYPGAKGGTYAVPEGTERIAPGAFRGSRVERVDVPGTVKTIAADAFRDCRNLRRVVLAEGVEELGEAAFAGCGALWEFEMPDSTVRAGKGLFAGCGGLMLAVVPDSLAGAGESWQVPDGCTIVARSAWEEERKGRRFGSAVAPFYGLYTGKDLDTAVFEGTVLAASALPDPEKNDYDDCLCALLVEVDSVLSTTPASAEVERVVLVNVPVLEGRTLLRQNVFEPGDKVCCTCAPCEAMPQGILEIQLSDDIQSFEHRPYYPLRIEKITAFRETGNRDFAKREITILPVRTLPRDAGAAAARRERMRKEIARVESELAEHGGSFAAWKEEYKPVAEKYGRLRAEGWAGWIGDSYFAAGGRETDYHTQAYIEQILPYKKYLEDNNIDLIVVRIPSKWDFAARVLAADEFQENPAWMEHYYECLKNDIEIIDPMPAMWKARFDYPLFYFYHFPDERHPLEGMSFVLAKEIADVLERYPYPKSATEIVLKDVLYETDDPLFFWPGGNGKFDSSKNLVFKQAVRDGEPVDQFVIFSGSPFLFLSNSYFWFPQRPLGASVPGYAAYFLQAVPDWRYRGGIGNLMVSYLMEPHLLDFRRAVVMGGAFDAWRDLPAIPKYIQDGARRIVLEKTMDASSDEITIHCHDSFSHSVAADGALWFEAAGNPQAQSADHFDLGFAIPDMDGKSTVMIRANIVTPDICTVDLADAGSGEVVDTVRVLPDGRPKVDFFLPLPIPGRDVELRFIPRHPEKGMYVKNVEFWYY